LSPHVPGVLTIRTRSNLGALVVAVVSRLSGVGVGSIVFILRRMGYKPTGRATYRQ
jgi:hypothetical protein